MPELRIGPIIVFLTGGTNLTFKKRSCQLMGKECSLSTGELRLGDMPRNSVVRITNLTEDISGFQLSGLVLVCKCVKIHTSIYM